VSVETPAPEPSAESLLVASIPCSHVYIAHLAALDGGGPRWLAHPLPEGAPNRYGTRWPPVRLPMGWLRHAHFDVLHVQFDFDVYEVGELREIVATVRRRGIPLVFTVHDLTPTTSEDAAAHAERLALLVDEADALVTLTPGAAAEIRRRWGREATVVPHPHVVDLDAMARGVRRRALRRDDEWHIGLHLRWMRANMDPTVVPVLAQAVNELPGAVLDVFIHHDAMQRLRSTGAAPTCLTDLDVRGPVRVHPHDEMTDPELWSSLTSLDATVLPYRFGSHSGWLEACRDLGTTVIVPDCGYYHEQGPTLVYGVGERTTQDETLLQAVHEAYSKRPLWGASVEERIHQRAQINADHTALYHSLLR
jgi:beta-1,4-mannosyltransferase